MNLVFFIHECVITFGSEVEFYWRRKLTGASLLYLSSKYISLAYSILCLVRYLPIFTDEVSSDCHILLLYSLTKF